MKPITNTLTQLTVLLASLVPVSMAHADDRAATWFDRKTEWNGYEQFHFRLADRPAYLVAPKRPATGNPWVWRARFPGYHAEMDIALLGKGYHIAYIDVSDMFGSPHAVKIGDEFYQYLTTRHSLSRKPCLEGVSRGGLFVYNWAAKNTDKVACIYCDTPVCDFKSWPGGKGDGLGSDAAWRQCLKAYGLSEEQAIEFDQNPINHAEAIAKAKIPTLHIVSEDDRVVPPKENTYLLQSRLQQFGHDLEVLSVPKGTAASNGHHFEHPDPQRVVEFIVRKTKRPNIVLIFVDDMGYGDLGCYGNQVNKTPNIDRLAAEGQRWTSFYSSGSVCVPSRRGLMTGRHPALMGRANLVGARDKLMAAMLKEHGYATAILGKWHLAGYPKDFTDSPMHPLECGFDHHFGTPGSNDVPAPEGRVQNRELFDACDKLTFQVPLIRGREVIEFPANQELFTSRYTAEAVNWIKRQGDDSFFLYLAHNMPHAPVFASAEFQGRSQGGRYGDVIEEIDWSVGQVMKAIKDAGIEEQTLVVFTSDNGPWSMFGPHGGTAAPLRGEKGTSWEGGYRVPGIFRWPGRIKPGVVDGMAANLDLYATFAKLASGLQPATETSTQSGYISKDFSGTLLFDDPSPRKQWLYSGGAIAFRSARYKIHLSSKDRSSNPDTRRGEPVARHDPPLLFDLSKDIGEQHNISADHPEIVARLLREMASFRGEQ